MDRAVTYTYPNNFVTDAYTFVIPSGNTEVVKFYQGGDTAPGSEDDGFGVMLTSPVRSIISLNPYTATMFGFREVASNRPFDGARSEEYNNKYDAVFAGEDIGFNVDTEEHDAGLMIQWNLGTTPGTWTGTMQQFVVRQGANMSAAFTPSSTSPGTSSDLTLTLDNVNNDAAYALGYSLTLPVGLTIAPGDQTNTCGGEVTADEATTDIILGKGTLAASASCTLTIPVVGEEIGTYTFDEQSAADLKGGIVADLSDAVLTIAEGSTSLTSAEDSTPITLAQTGCSAIESSSTTKESTHQVQDPAFQYPVGFAGFTMTGCSTSSNVNLTFTGTYDPTKAVIRKYNSVTKTYTTLTNANSGLVLTTTTLNNQPALQVSYTITDNGPLDQDPTTGTITDPVGIGTNVVVVPNTGLGWLW